jgi:aromatic ring-opening dioxygenase LigB subunit
MNIDKKDVTDTNKQPDGDANSILLCSPHDIQGDDKSSVVNSQKLVANTQLATKMICLLSYRLMATLM